MNNDNCNGEWHPASAEELKNAWQSDYERRAFVRWSIRNKTTSVAIGTIEIAPLPWGRWFFGAEPPIGILRLDLLSSYEKREVFSEIIHMMASELADDFEVTKMIMKAPPDEPERVSALLSNGFYPDTKQELRYDDYFIRINPAKAAHETAEDPKPQRQA